MAFSILPNRSLQTRIIALFLLLMVFGQVGGFVLINTVGLAAAHKTVAADLAIGTREFHRLLEQDAQRLVQGARLLTSDYAFREAVATRDRATIASVLANHGKRIDASLMMLIGLDQRVIADSLDVATGRPFSFAGLIEKAEVSQQAAAMVVVDGALYQLVVLPVLAPLPMAWVAVGVRVNDVAAQDLRNLTGLQVSFLTRGADDLWKFQASTLAEPDRALLLQDAAEQRLGADDAEGQAADNDTGVTRVLNLSAQPGQRIVAVLQKPLALALEPFRRLQRQLALVSLLVILVSIIAIVAIARGIARPVRELASVARRIAAGDYSMVPPASRQDEIGDLTAAFRAMQDGIAAREAQITDLAYRDALTGLPNRVLYTDRLDQALALAGRTGTPVAVLLMDLDHFKYVNDTLGHPIGDLLLREVTGRLQAVVRRATDTVARLGGDEFAILLPGDRAPDARRVAEAILRVLEAPMTLEGHVVDIGASIGVASYPEHGDESSQLLRHADVAMYAAKRGNLGVAVWDDRYDKHGVERLSLMSDLRKAVDEDQLVLVYQPKVPLYASDEHFVEALVRWQHPTRGLVPPVEFIPFAEQTGYIRAITQWVLGHAVAQCAAWRNQGLPMNVSINISARDLMDAELPDRFAALLEREGCAAQWIALEITESGILDDPGHAIRNLERLHALGCKLAIDDYGTGYSSLAYLRRLPVDELKIDKSFVTGMANDPGDAIIVRSTIDLGHNMGLVVVAEGVEDEATFEQLRALGCDTVQGYWISRPLGAIELADWVRESVWTRPGPKKVELRRVG
jgi:diguanylate cyclase (GGDEF)-like protein